MATRRSTPTTATRAKLSGEGSPDAASGLRAEIGKRGPFASPEQEAYLNLLRTHSVLSAEFDRLFRGEGLGESTYNALRILRGAGDEGRACHEIGAHLVARVPDVTRLVDRLEAAGLVERRRDERDRRVVRVHITPRGLEVLGRLDTPVLELHERQLGHMSAEELATLSALLAKARVAVGAGESGSGANAETTSAP